MTPLQYAQQICYSSKETLQFTYECAKEMSDMEGVFVECGCAAGAQIIAMHVAAPHKTVYAFDSFQGIPLPSNRDDQMPGLTMLTKAEQQSLPDPGKQVLMTSGATVVSMENFYEHLYGAFGVREHPNIITVPGWFEDTMKEEFTPEISLLRLDGDLYNSTFVCLNRLFPNVERGGAVIIDDWTLPGCRAACEEYFGFIGFQPNYKFISTIAYFIR